MDEFLPVHWAEGMLLTPHVFQAMDRHRAKSLLALEELYHPCSYGIHSVEIDRDEITQHRVGITSCKARTDRGTYIRLNHTLPNVPEQLEEALAQAKDGKVTVHFCIYESMWNDPSREETHRFEIVLPEMPVEDENAQAVARRIQLRRLKISYNYDAETPAGFERLPVGRVVMSSSGPRWDESFVPPLLAVGGDSRFYQKFVEGFRADLGGHVRKLAAQIRLQERGGPGGLPSDDWLRFVKLVTLSRAVSRLATVTPRTHPYDLYIEACALVGEMAPFLGSPLPVKLPPYDHENLLRCFSELRGSLDPLLATDGPAEPDTQQGKIGTGLNR